MPLPGSRGKTMTIGTIDEQRAKELAYAFVSVIPDYIERHKERYIEYLKATSQTDEQYYKPNTEAADK